MTSPRTRAGKRERTLGPTISYRQAEAVKAYGRLYETLSTSTSPEARIAAQQTFMKARSVLGVQEVAILDLVAGKGRSISDVAIAAGRPRPAMEELILSAGGKLADHFEAEPTEPN